MKSETLSYYPASVIVVEGDDPRQKTISPVTLSNVLFLNQFYSAVRGKRSRLVSGYNLFS